jgi:glutathione synthase/RimK-type ligase-like ATP-grasp enzyme
MDSWVLVVSQPRDLAARDLPHVVVTSDDYVARPYMFAGAPQKVINLARSYRYQTAGYYCSLLAEARGHRVLPSVETILELSSRNHYAHALPELEEALNRDARSTGDGAPKSLFVAFGRPDAAGFEQFAELLFDWYRAPALTVTLKGDEWHSIARIELTPITRFSAAQQALFTQALKAHTARKWRAPRQRPAPRYSIAVLHDAKDPLPPSKLHSLEHWAKVAARLGVEVEPIGRRDISRLAEFDALFIRETTSIRNHTYRFARRAAQEGMPVIDDPVSMIRCTNKIYLWERLTHAGLPVPHTVVIQDEADVEQVADALGFPVVVKIPDGSFSRGVRKAADMPELRAIVDEFFEDTDLLLAQKFVPTRFDWRVGVLDGEPLFVCQYRMAKKHWQIVRHNADGTAEEGLTRSFSLESVPPAVLDAGVRAARLIGDGLYGVDIKETGDGVYVIEVNDNPNLDHGIEDGVGRQDIWLRLTRWFISRVEAGRQ